MTASTLADQVYDHILAQLMERMLRPGELLDRKQIAQELNVSLIPVADAVQRLTHEGFLTTRRRQGTFVTTPNREDVRGQLLLREALECQCARLYCGEPIRKGRRGLLPLARAADKAADAGRQLWLEDFAFHQALVAFTEVEALVTCFARVVNMSMFHQTSMISPVAAVTYDRHTRLLDDLCSASPEEAEARVREHIRSGKEAMKEKKKPGKQA